MSETAQVDGLSAKTSFPEALDIATHATESGDKNKRADDLIVAVNADPASQSGKPDSAATEPPSQLLEAPSPALLGAVDHNLNQVDPNSGAPPGLILRWSGPDIAGQNVTPNPISRREGERHAARPSSEESGVRALSIAGVSLNDAPVAIPPLASAVHRNDLRDQAKTEIVRDTSGQSGTIISVPLDQGIALEDLPASAPADPISGLLSADPVDAAVLQISTFGSTSSGSTEADQSSGAPRGSLQTIPWPVSAGNIAAATFRSPAQDSAEPFAISSPGAADLQSILTGNTAPSALPGEGSPISVVSNRSTDLSDQVFQHVVRLADNAGSELVLRLHPPELGDLTIRVLVNGRDVSAWFASPQIPVQQAISQAIDQLQTHLGNAGYNLNSAWVGADSRGPREQNQDAPIPQRRGTVNRPSLAEPSSAQIVSAGSGVSVYV